jgi:hypothetical protein
MTYADSAVPSGLAQPFFVDPALETPGYCRQSLRDLHLLQSWLSATERTLVQGKRIQLTFNIALIEARRDDFGMRA